MATQDSSLAELEKALGCRACARSASHDCGQGHVYAYLLPHDQRVYIGSTSKSIMERLADNTRKRPDGRWKYNAPSARAFREQYEEVGLLMEMVLDWNPVGSKDKSVLRAREQELAVSIAKEYPDIVWCDQLPDEFR